MGSCWTKFMLRHTRLCLWHSLRSRLDYTVRYMLHLDWRLEERNPAAKLSKVGKRKRWGKKEEKKKHWQLVVDLLRTWLSLCLEHVVKANVAAVPIADLCTLWTLICRTFNCSAVKVIFVHFPAHAISSLCSPQPDNRGNLHSTGLGK